MSYRENKTGGEEMGRGLHPVRTSDCETWRWRLYQLMAFFLPHKLLHLCELLIYAEHHFTSSPACRLAAHQSLAAFN